MRKLLLLSMIILAAGAPVLFAGGQGQRAAAPAATPIAASGEAPMLAAMVARGELPPVAERLPVNPFVVQTYESIGRYGGDLRQRISSHGDFADFWYMLETYMIVPKAYLFDQAGQPEFVPEKAESVTWNADVTQVTIKLREGMKWSDGAPVTADDIVFYYEDVILNSELTPTVPSIFAPSGQRANLVRIDDYTVRFEFAVPNPPFINYLSWFGGLQERILEPSHYVKQFHITYNENATRLAQEAGFDRWTQLFNARKNNHPSQTNLELPTLHPWMLTEVGTSRVVYTRNPYFWAVDSAGNQLPYIDRLVLEIVSDAEVTKLRTVAGDFDIGRAVFLMDDYPLIKENEDSGNYDVRLFDKQYSSETMFALNLNHQDPVKRSLFNDIRFRQALSVAIDRNEINELLFLGMAQEVQVAPVPSTSFYKPEWSTYYAQHDPALARQLLEQIGMRRGADGFYRAPNGSEFVIIVENFDHPLFNSTVELVASHWQNVGIQVAQRPVAGGLFNTRIDANEHDLYMWVETRLIEPRIHMPGSPQFNPRHFMPLWGRWNSTRGEQGEEPPEHVKRWFSLLDEWYKHAPGSAEYQRIGGELFQIYSENLWFINSVGLAPQPATISRRLRNVPASEDLVLSEAWGQWRPAWPTQWYFVD